MRSGSSTEGADENNAYWHFEQLFVTAGTEGFRRSGDTIGGWVVALGLPSRVAARAAAGIGAVASLDKRNRTVAFGRAPG